MRGTTFLGCTLAAGIVVLVARAAPGQPSPHGPPPQGASAPLPSGHPPVGDEDDDLPGGHPPVSGEARARLPPTNALGEDPSVPADTVVVEVRDGAGAPVPGADVVLGIVENSIAKGESRRRIAGTTNAEGSATFSGVGGDSATAFRVSVVRDGATYAAPPSAMPRGRGLRGVIHVFPVTREIKGASIAIQGMVYVELRDEIVQVEQSYRIYNLGAVAWLPTNETISLPPGFKAFNSQKVMSDVAWDGGKSGASLRGTISPGVHETAFKYQVPLDDEDMTLDLGLLPNVQAFRIIVDAPKGMTLDVAGFPPAQPATSGTGQRVMVTEKETPRLDPTFRRATMHLGRLPTRGGGRWWALALAASTALGGLAYAVRRPAAAREDREERETAKARILDEIAELEAARKAGDVGPRTYEAARRTLVDALANLLTADSSAAADPTGREPALAFFALGKTRGEPGGAPREGPGETGTVDEHPPGNDLIPPGFTPPGSATKKSRFM